MKPPVVCVSLNQFCEASQEPLYVLQKAGFDVRLNKLGRRPTKTDLPSLLQDVDAVVAGVEPYDSEILSKLPNLKCISRCGIGTDAIDMDFAHKKGVTVMITTDEVVLPVAQMTVAMMLALARNLQFHVTDARAGQWKKHTGWLLSEWTIGLVGFGRIGRAVAKCLEPFGCDILVFDPHIKQDSLPPFARLTDFQTLLKESNVVSLHAASKPEDGHLMGEAEFSQMRPGSFFVNTARGYMVDEKALLKALQSKHLAGAALDVYEEEPYKGPLMGLPNVICTPHVATLTNASRMAMELRAAQNVVSFFKSKALCSA